LVMLGMQFISMGLLAEMIASSHREGDSYTIRKRLPAEPKAPGPAEREGGTR
jgi:hypothetical protein